MKNQFKIFIVLLCISSFLVMIQNVGTNIHDEKVIQQPESAYAINSTYFFSNNSESVNIAEIENQSVNIANQNFTSVEKEYKGHYKGTKTFQFDIDGQNPSGFSITSGGGSGSVFAEYLNHKKILKTSYVSGYNIYYFDPSNSGNEQSFWLDWYMLSSLDTNGGLVRLYFTDGSYIFVYHANSGINDYRVIYQNSSGLQLDYYFGGDNNNTWDAFSIYMNWTSKRFAVYLNSNLVYTFTKMLTASKSCDKVGLNSPLGTTTITYFDSLSLDYVSQIPSYVHNDFLYNVTTNVINQSLFLNFNQISNRNYIINGSLDYAFKTNITQLMNLSLYCALNNSFVKFNSSIALDLYENQLNLQNFTDIWFYMNRTLQIRIESENLTNLYELELNNWSMIVNYFNLTSIMIYPLTTMYLYSFDMPLFIELMLFVLIVGLVIYTLKQYPNSKILIGIWLILLIFYLGISLLISELPINVIIIIFTFLIVILSLHLVRLYNKK